MEIVHKSCENASETSGRIACAMLQLEAPARTRMHCSQRCGMMMRLRMCPSSAATSQCIMRCAPALNLMHHLGFPSHPLSTPCKHQQVPVQTVVLANGFACKGTPQAGCAVLSTVQQFLTWLEQRHLAKHVWIVLVGRLQINSESSCDEASRLATQQACTVHCDEPDNACLSDHDCLPDH